ncbi:MAG: hypothetical protein RIC03_02825 [Cyclobacteriaceae bacterium]
MYYFNRITRLLPVIFIVIVAACNNPETKSMEVTATAYNSVKEQTNDNPSLTAWGDTLEPGMKAIAISRDLLDSGFYHNMEVTIDGLEGTYKVMDKMNRRWTQKIDIYMGTDVAKAREWGKKKVVINWTPATEK